VTSFDHELRLLHCIVLNAIVVVSAWRMVRRTGEGDRVRAVLDTGLLWFLVQYLSVGLPGIAGILSNFTISACAVFLSAAMWVPFRRATAPTLLAEYSLVVPLACLLFVGGYVAALIVQQRYMPVISIDALAYHLPAAVHWLQEGRIGLHEIWFYNPANAYSPLAGSIFAAWWIAPIGNDAVGRFMQMPAMFILAVGVTQICRNLGASAFISVLIATAAVLSRPIVSESIFPKDDLYLSAFFVTAVAGLGAGAMRDRSSAWRVGIAAGLMLVTKYTALLTVPMLLLAVDAPLRAKWCLQRWLIAVSCVIVLAGPWYLRNALLTCNPLYPVDNFLFDGMFQTTASEQLRSVSGVWHVLTGAYHSLPIALMILLIVGWLTGIFVTRSRLKTDPLVRLCAFGPVIGLSLFVLVSPYPEIRFIYPALLLMACLGATCIASIANVVSNRTSGQIGNVVVGTLLGIVVIFVAGTAFYGELGWEFAAVGVLVSLVGTGAWLAMRWMKLEPQVQWGMLAVAVLVGGLYAYVYWRSYVRDYRESLYVSWPSEYGPIAEAWQFVREKLPANAVVAYANTYLTYPLYGFDLDRHVVYALLQKGRERYIDLPEFPEKATDQNMRRMVETITVADPDLDAWLAHLNERKATHLLVAKPDPTSGYESAPPPELNLIAQRPEMFKRIYDNRAAAVFLIEKSSSAN